MEKACEMNKGHAGAFRLGLSDCNAEKCISLEQFTCK